MTVFKHKRQLDALIQFAWILVDVYDIYAAIFCEFYLNQSDGFMRQTLELAQVGNWKKSSVRSRDASAFIHCIMFSQIKDISLIKTNLNFGKILWATSRYLAMMTRTVLTKLCKPWSITVLLIPVCDILISWSSRRSSVPCLHALSYR